MGMYAELHYNAELVPSVSEQVLDVLRYMLGDREEEPELPEHPLFSTQRWRYMLTMDSYYFAADTHSTLRLDWQEAWYLCVRCNVKNYDGEIEKFIDWIDPYVRTDGFLGFYRYEESEEPTLIHKSDPAGQEQRDD